MSAWLVLVRRLHAEGGGPLRITRFDQDMPSRLAASDAAQYAKHHGLMTVTPQHYTWKLTEKGRKVATGELVRRRLSNQAGCRGTVFVPPLATGTIGDELIAKLLREGGISTESVSMPVMRDYSARLLSELTKMVASQLAGAEV